MVVAYEEELPEDATVCQKIVRDIILDILDRCGLQNEWEAIDMDLQRVIEDEWVGIAENHVETLYRKEK